MATYVKRGVAVARIRPCDGDRQARVTEDEIRAAIRSAGIDALDQVHEVVLETDGSFSVVRPGVGGNGSSLVGVDGPQKFR